MKQNFNTILAMPPEEFFDMLKECFAEALFAPEESNGVKVKKHYVYGLQGICDLFGCSKATASRIKNSGAIDEAISQVGKIVIIDADLAVDLLKVKGCRNYGKRKDYDRRTHVSTVHERTSPYSSGRKGAGNYKCGLVNSKPGYNE